MFAFLFTILILGFAFWLILPTIRPRVARTPAEAGTMETEIPRAALEEELITLYAAAEDDPSLREDAGWLNKRERIWSQLNYIRMCTNLNALSGEDSDERH